jgi:hypothetical protein
VGAKQRLIAGLVGGLGLGALLRFRSRTAAPPESGGTNLAEELRQTLAASRAAQARAEEPAAEPPSAATDLESRRREVHDRARRSIEELVEPGDSV